LGGRTTSVPQSESEWERLFDLSHDLFCIAGFDGYFTRVNLAFEQTLGYSRQELVSRPFLDLVHPDDLESSRLVLADLQRGEDLIGFVNRVICADGSVRWLEWNTRSMPDERFVYGIARDVTDRRRAEADLRKAQQMVEASRDEFRLLSEEHAALRRVATLVAQRAPPAEIFSAVSEEVGQLLGADQSAVGRFEPDGPAIVLVGAGEDIEGMPAGTRWELDDALATAAVFRTGRAARVDESVRTAASGPIPDSLRRLGIRGTVASPIVVEGRLWGAMTVSTKREPLPPDTEARLANFTELVATAIANTESRAALGVLADEQAALRRVATLVARGLPPGEIFAAVAEEIGRLVSIDGTRILRYEADGTATVIAGWSESIEVPPELGVGARLPLEGESLAALVLRSGRPARIDSYADAAGPLSEPLRAAGVRSAAGVPIVVEGRLWGVVAVGSTKPEPLPSGMELRLAEFTELVATAVANTESRSELAQLAEEQAALRRVATLVARGTPPEEVFAAVTEEIGRLLGTSLAGMARYESDDTLTVVATWSEGEHGGAHPLVPGPWPLDGDDLASTVWRTGRSVRIDDYHGVPGRIAAFVRDELGVLSSAGSPIAVEGRLWGVLFVHAKQTDEPLPLDTESRLTGFTELVATAVANADSRAELMASRARIVAAADETRRRIERDLHDGIQQRLVSLGLELRAAQAAVPPQLGEFESMLSRVAGGLASVFDELREISRGIHPAILSEGGLEPALRAVCRRSAVPVELVMNAERRLPERVEVAVYYVVSEALTNAAKHAHASVVHVELEADDAIMQLAIRDDGIGGADFSPGSGLVGLSDRIEALGGTLQVSSPAGSGTSLLIEVPLEGQRGRAF
jgi:PAS domain S-box-containing protein